MKTRRHFLLNGAALTLGSLGLSGCATGPLFDPKSLEPIARGMGRFVLYKKQSPALFGARGRLKFDDQYREIDTHQFVVFDVDPGQRMVNIRPLKSLLDGPGLTFPVSIDAGQTVYGCLVIVSGSLSYGTVPADVAARQMRGFKRA